MKELFRLRIGQERQTVVPQRFMEQLGLQEGDEIWIFVEGKKISSTFGQKTIQNELFSPEIVSDLEKREQEIKSGHKLHDSEIRKILEK